MRVTISLTNNSRIFPLEIYFGFLKTGLDATRLPSSYYFSFFLEIFLVYAVT